MRIKELAQEARFIRFEESKIKSKRKIVLSDPEFWNLRDHRTHNVRDAARAIQLSYGFMRGVPYRRIEKPTKSLSYWEIRKWDKIVKEIKRLATKFSFQKINFDDEIDNWLSSDIM